MQWFRNTGIGRIGISARNGAIDRLWLPGRYAGREEPGEAGSGTDAELLREAFSQLDAYLRGRRRTFELPLHPEGSPFMLRVWQALCDVPYACTASYRDIAVAIGQPKACRAVGMANNRNPIAIFIPCHRIIGSNGALVGYGGGLDLKRRLLALEQRHRAESGLV